MTELIKPPFVALQKSISHASVEALQELLDDAKNGRMIGFAFVAMYTEPERHFIFDAAGEAHRNPVNTLGMLSILDDHLRKKATHESTHN